MKDERTALRKTFRSRQRPVMRYLIAAGLLLAVVAAGVSWTITDIHRAEYSPNARLIRTQLEESIREAYDRETAEAGKLRDGKERQKALRDAAQARDQRLAEGDDFIRSITLTIVRGQASPELLELARILEEQGVKAALDYLSSQESRLLDQTSQLRAMHQGQVDSTLGLLLEGVRLYRDRGDLAEAERLCDKLLAADPDSSAALDERVWTMIASGHRALRNEELDTARQRFESARSCAEHLRQIEQDNEYTNRWQRDLSAAYNGLGNVSWKGGRLDAAREFYQRGVDIAKDPPAGDSADFDTKSNLWSVSCRVGAVRRDVDMVAHAAEELRNLEPKTPENLYAAACGYGVCAKLAAGWPGQGPFPPPKGTADAKAPDVTREQNDLRTAINLLQAAVQAGFKDVAWMREDPDLAALRDLPEFKKLLTASDTRRRSGNKPLVSPAWP